MTIMIGVANARAPLRLALAIVTAFALAPGAMASDTLAELSVGQDLTYNGASHPRTLQAALNNPASPAASGRRGVWFGLGAASASYELGNVSDFETRLDEISQSLDGEINTLSEARARRDDINSFIGDLGERGYANIQARGQPPLMPLGAGLPGIGGQLSLGLGALVNARVEFLDKPLCINGPASIDNPPECPPLSGGDLLTSDSAAYIKGAAGAVASLGYSSEALYRRDGKLVAGFRINRYEMELSKGVHRLDNEGADGEPADVADGLEDEFDRNRSEDSASGVDVGLLWKSRLYRLGATVYNLNEPSLDYPSIGTNCDSLNDPVAENNCLTAQEDFPNQIDKNETHTMARQTELEAGIFSPERTWSLSGTYDVSSAPDVVGDEQQWFSVTGAYSARGWWVPGLRLGYKVNQAGSELSYYTGGITLFRVINIDAAVSEQTVEADGEDTPRAASVSVGLEFFF